MPKFPVKERPLFNKTMEQMDATTRGSFEVFNPIWQLLLDNDNALECKLSTKELTLYAIGWGEAQPYQQRVDVTGITEGMVLDVTPIIPEDTTAEQEKAIRKAAGCISHFHTFDGGVMATCIGKRPATDVRVMVRGCR